MQHLVRQFCLLCLLFFALPLSAWATDITIAPMQINGFQPTNLGQAVAVTATVTNGSATVTSAGVFRSAWVGLNGFTVAIGGNTYYARVDSTSSMVITPAFFGVTGSTNVLVYPYVEARLYSSLAFYPAGSNDPVQPGAPQNGGPAFRRYAAGIINSGGVNILRLPEMVLPATTDGSPTTQARYTMAFHRADGSLVGGAAQIYTCNNVSQFRIPNTPSQLSTTGTISVGSATLTVANATGWAIGATIRVRGAGASGADLLTTILNIVSTTFTLNAVAGGSVTSAVVDQNALTTWKNICDFNAATTAPNEPDRYYTQTQIDAREPNCTTNQLIYNAATGRVRSCLNVGSGLTIGGGVLQASDGASVQSITITGNTTLTPVAGALYLVDTNAGALTLSLNAGGAADFIFHIKQTTADGNLITLAPQGGATIDNVYFLAVGAVLGGAGSAVQVAWVSSRNSYFIL